MYASLRASLSDHVSAAKQLSLPTIIGTGLGAVSF